MRVLSFEQLCVLSELKAKGCYFTATAFERAWSEGRAYYLDSRVRIPGIRRRIKHCNNIATGRVLPS